MRRARKRAPPGRNRSDRLRVARDRCQSCAQGGDIVDVLDRDAAVAIRYALAVRQLADHFSRPDQTGATHEHLARYDGSMKCDRKILLETACGETRVQELGHSPMR